MWQTGKRDAHRSARVAEVWTSCPGLPTTASHRITDHAPTRHPGEFPSRSRPALTRERFDGCMLTPGIPPSPKIDSMAGWWLAGPPVRPGLQWAGASCGLGGSVACPCQGKRGRGRREAPARLIAQRADRQADQRNQGEKIPNGTEHRPTFSQTRVSQRVEHIDPRPGPGRAGMGHVPWSIPVR